MTTKTFTIGGDLTVNRVGFGAMRITGPGVFGEPDDRQSALEVVRRAVELGVNFIDTADQYRSFVSEELIAEALHPYAEGVVIATKGGLASPSSRGIRSRAVISTRRAPSPRSRSLMASTSVRWRSLGSCTMPRTSS